METKAIWYVYQLVDPRTMKPFYIGKGKGNRIDYHEREASKGVCSKKCKLINELTKENLIVIKEKIALFWDESAAYQCEKEVINFIGLRNLTNVMPGGIGALSFRHINSRKRVINQKFTPEDCFMAVSIAKDKFAIWLKNMGKEAIVSMPDNSAFSKFKKNIWEFFYNGYAAKVFGKAAEDSNNHEKLAKMFAPYNIALEFK